MSVLKEKNHLLSQTKLELEAKVDSLSSEVDDANTNLRSSSRNAEVYTTQVGRSLSCTSMVSSAVCYVGLSQLGQGH